jgi:hypothetical protein
MQHHDRALHATLGEQRVVDAGPLDLRHLGAKAKAENAARSNVRLRGASPPRTAEVTSLAPKEWPIRCRRGTRAAAKSGPRCSRPRRSPTCPARRFITQNASACAGDSAPRVSRCCRPRRSPSSSSSSSGPCGTSTSAIARSTCPDARARSGRSRRGRGPDPACHPDRRRQRASRASAPPHAAASHARPRASAPGRGSEKNRAAVSSTTWRSCRQPGQKTKQSVAVAPARRDDRAPRAPRAGRRASGTDTRRGGRARASVRRPSPSGRARSAPAAG